MASLIWFAGVEIYWISVSVLDWFQRPTVFSKKAVSPQKAKECRRGERRVISSSSSLLWPIVVFIALLWPFPLPDHPFHLLSTNPRAVANFMSIARPISALHSQRGFRGGFLPLYGWSIVGSPMVVLGAEPPRNGIPFAGDVTIWIWGPVQLVGNCDTFWASSWSNLVSYPW